MREIKFRVWDKKYKMIMTVNEIDFEKNTVWLEADNGDHENRHTLTRDFNDVVLMQSTGLKDKNGVEIYEGDVCKLSGGLDDYWYIVEWLFAGWQLVTYKKPNAKVRGISDGINQCYLEPNIASNLVVVGNIHENPELLERINE